MKRNLIALMFATMLSLTWFAGCDEADDVPDFDVHVINLEYGSAHNVLYSNGYNDIYISGGNGGWFSCYNCKIEYYGDIIEAGPEQIEIDAAQKVNQTVANIPTINMNPKKGYIMKGSWKNSSGTVTKDISFYLYFTDYQHESAVGYYRPRVAHYQRFK